MSKIPVISAKEFEKLLLKIGFVKVRQKGSHVFYRHADGRYTTLTDAPQGRRLKQTAHKANFKGDKDDARRIQFIAFEKVIIPSGLRCGK